MKRSSLFVMLILGLLLAACGTAPADQGADQNGNNPPETPYPGPRYITAPTSTPWYPGPGTPGAPVNGASMTSGFEPQPSDASLSRSQVFLELDSGELITMDSTPLQVTAVLTGNLPDPCHQLRVVVTPANSEKRIDIEVYSLTDPSVACTTVLSPFVARIPLGGYFGGQFSVYVNGELFGEFDS